MARKTTSAYLVAEFDSAAKIYKACEKVRDGGFTKWDACTPFPVHGLDDAMGLKPSRLPWFVLIAGIMGCVISMGGMIYLAAYEQPLNIGGKPLWSIPAFIPITFEVTVLFSALTAAFGMFVINRLPTFNHAVFNSERFERVTNDKFFIIIDQDDPKFRPSETSSMLQASGASHLEEVRGD